MGARETALNALIACRKEGGWSNGYGYQLWTIEQKPSAFRFDGAYGQYSIVFPEENAVLATQCSEYQEAWKMRKALLDLIIEA